MDGELPDFNIPHGEKISWMVETNGWALESVAAGVLADSDGVPVPSFSYTINFPAAFSMPEVVVLGLTPVACRGLCDLIADICASGQVVEIGSEVVGLFDGEQRAKFLPVDVGSRSAMFQSAISWHRGTQFPVVQLLWPDRNGFLPDEPGFDQRLRFAQPVLG